MTLSVGVSSHAFAQDWGKMATVSSSMGVNAGRLCLGEASRGDIGCPTYAPSVSTAGNVSITGNISANKFIGDGTGLTGVTAGSSDRIVSGTTAVYANNDTGYVSFTSAGLTTGWYSPSGIFAAVGISTTSNQASFTTIYTGGLATMTSGISLTGNLTGAGLISTTSGGTVSATNVNGNTGTFTTLNANSIGAGNINASGQITATAVGANLISATAAT
ncbi:MAG TPA: hypothetical protein VHP58_05315, partial [Alphaproteobacteria bacterium]|nr:hypothetical protein [Alphaproteobacteria bacterium]